MADRWRQRVRDYVGDRALSDEIVEELAEHLADVYEAQRRFGCDEREAEARALEILSRSSCEALVRRPRAALRPSRLTDVGFDVRYSWRSMLRQPAFSAAVVAILAVSIGAATAGFGVIDTVLLRALPYPDPDRIVAIKHVTPAGESRAHATADWRDYAVRNRASIALAAYATWPMNVTGGGDPERLRSVIVSGNFFDVLATPPLIGRALASADDAPGAGAVAVLSHGLWRRRFGGDPSAIGRTITLNNRTVTIVGVMRPEFDFPDRTTDLWMPMQLPRAVVDDRASEWVSLVGRLRSGVSVGQAQAELDTTAAALASAYPKTNANERVAVRPLLDEMVGGVRRALLLGGLAVAFVLIAGCANAGSLMTARTTFRRDEIAIRSALGAEPARLARQLVVESLVLAGFGGALGIAAAWLFDRAFVVLAAGRVPRIEQLELDGAALFVAAAATVGSAVVFGGASAWFLLPRTAERELGSTPRATRSSRAGAVLLAVQVAFALALTAGAAIVASSYTATAAIDPGFDVGNTLTLQVSLPRSRYADSASHVRFAERAVAELSSVPGVESVGVTTDLPFVANALHFRVRSGAGTAPEESMTVRPADGGFFQTLRIAPLAGRLFTTADRAGAPLVALINRSAANRLGVDGAVGRQLVVAGEPVRTIVGIVPDVKHAGLRADEGPVVYVPFAQKTFDFVGWMGIVARGPAVEASVPAIRDALKKVDPNQPVSAIQTMAGYVDEQTAPYRFGALIVFSLSAVALVLAVTGVYGMAAFIVGRQTRELGIRMALGASRGSVIGFVITKIAIVVGAGALIGAAIAAMTNTMLQRALEDVPTFGSNASALVSAAALMIAASVCAALMPALRAARIDPKTALQAE